MPTKAGSSIMRKSFENTRNEAIHWTASAQADLRAIHDIALKSLQLSTEP
jgi:hypothetical protein